MSENQPEISNEELAGISGGDSDTVNRINLLIHREVTKFSQLTAVTGNKLDQLSEMTKEIAQRIARP